MINPYLRAAERLRPIAQQKLLERKGNAPVLKQVKNEPPSPPKPATPSQGNSVDKSPKVNRGGK